MKPDSTPIPPLARRLGGFRIEREIGRGGFGIVYDAIQEDLDRRVALKIYDASFAVGERDRARFEREATIAASIDHPHVLPIYKVGEIEGVPYLAMQRVDGCSLAQVLDEFRATSDRHIRRSTFLAAVAKVLGATLDAGAADRATADGNHAEAAAELALQAAEAMAAVHARGIVHRDLKPANLLLRRDGHLFVADFGLARDDNLATLTRSGEFQGTPDYMSPEQILADRKIVDHRSDIYSLGATLYELLTLRRPHAAPTATEIVRNIAFRRPVAPHVADGRVPRDLSLIVEKALERSPDDRYQSMADFAADLRRFLDHESVHASRIGASGRAWRLAARHKAWSTATVVALAGIVSAGWVANGILREQRDVQTREAERIRTRQSVLLAATREHLEAGRLDAALRSLDLAQEIQPDPRHHELRLTIAARARTLALAAVEKLESPAGAWPLADLIRAGDEITRVVAAVPAVRTEVGGARLDAASRYAAELDVARRGFPMVAGAFGPDPLAAAEDLGATLGAVLDRQNERAPSLELQVATDKGVVDLQQGRDFGLVRGATDDGAVGGEIVFGGYAIDNESPDFHDLRDVDARGRWVLCLRHCPGFERDDGPFGNAEQKRVVSAFTRKAEVAQRAGAIGLLVADRPLSPDQDETLVDSARATTGAIPIVHVRARFGEAWLMSAGTRLETVRARIDGEMRPQAFPIPGVRIALRNPAGDLVSPAALLPCIRRLVSRPHPVRGAALVLATVVPASDEVLIEVLAGGDVTDVAIVSLARTGKRSPAVASALRDVLARWRKDDVGRHERESWRYAESIGKNVVPERVRSQFGGPLLSPSPRNISPAGLALAALFDADAEAGTAAAREWLHEREWVAVYILSRSLADHRSALQAAFGEDSDKRPSFRWMLARVLAADGFAPAIADVARRLRRAMRSPFGLAASDEDTAVALLVKWPTPESSDVLLDVQLANQQTRDSLQLESCLRAPERLAQLETRLLAVLAEASAERVRALELLRAWPQPCDLPAALAARISELVNDPDPRVRQLAAAAVDPTKATAVLPSGSGALLQMLQTHGAAIRDEPTLLAIEARLAAIPAKDGRYLASTANGLAWKRVQPVAPEPGSMRLAVVLARFADRCADDSDRPAHADTLACALAATGDLAGAIETGERALSLLAPDQQVMRKDIEQHLSDFRRRAAERR